VAFAAQEERDDEVDGGSDEIDDDNGDDHDAVGGDSTDNDVWDWTNTQTKKADEIVAFAADEIDGGSDDIDDGSGDDRDADDSGDDRDADDSDSLNNDNDSSDDGDGEIADDADDAEVDVDPWNAYCKTGRANEEAYSVSVDGGADHWKASVKESRANSKAYNVYVKANKRRNRKQQRKHFDAVEEQLRKHYEKQEKGELDSDARIASNVPSEADRKFLEKRSTHCRAEYARALRERAARTESDALLQESDANYRVYVEASDTFIREHEELNARAKKECSAREANGEDARDVRARWEQFERYGCCGALDDAFFDPRNG
jgi:hypothetical protein